MHEGTSAPDVGTGATGHAGVDAALARLGELPGLPVPAHVDVYEDIHRRLQETLADLGGTGR